MPIFHIRINSNFIKCYTFYLIYKLVKYNSNLTYTTITFYNIQITFNKYKTHLFTLYKLYHAAYYTQIYGNKHSLFGILSRQDFILSGQDKICLDSFYLVWTEKNLVWTR